MISPSNTAQALTDPGQAWVPGYLRTAHNDNVQGQIMAEFAFNELGVTKAAAIHDGDPYTEGLANTFADTFEALGGQIVAFEMEASNATNVKPLLETIAAAEPELIYFPVFIPLGSQLTNTAAEVEGLEDVILAASDGVMSPSFLDGTAGANEGMYFTGADLNYTGSFYQTDFLSAYFETYGQDPMAPFHAHAFDATNMILDAIEAVAQQADDGTLLIGRQALRDALYSTTAHQGITGSLTCNEFGDCGDINMVISIADNGQFARVWP
jgi:branched-chain amino acid transport system substrate-binding protein